MQIIAWLSKSIFSAGDTNFSCICSAFLQLHHLIIYTRFSSSNQIGYSFYIFTKIISKLAQSQSRKNEYCVLLILQVRKGSLPRKSVFQILCFSQAWIPIIGTDRKIQLCQLPRGTFSYRLIKIQWRLHDSSNYFHNHECLQSFIQAFGTVPSPPITAGTTVHFVFHNFLDPMARSRYGSFQFLC